MKSKLILFAFISIFAFACKKDKVSPTLDIASPTDNAQSTGVIVIKGTVADEHLHTVAIKIVNDVSGLTVYSKQLAIDGLTTYSINEQYDPGVVLASSNVTLTIEVADKGGSKTTKTIKFTIKP